MKQMICKCVLNEADLGRSILFSHNILYSWFCESLSHVVICFPSFLCQMHFISLKICSPLPACGFELFQTLSFDSMLPCLLHSAQLWCKVHALSIEYKQGNLVDAPYDRCFTFFVCQCSNMPYPDALSSLLMLTLFYITILVAALIKAELLHDLIRRTSSYNNICAWTALSKRTCPANAQQWRDWKYQVLLISATKILMDIDIDCKSRGQFLHNL